MDDLKIPTMQTEQPTLNQNSFTSEELFETAKTDKQLQNYSMAESSRQFSKNLRRRLKHANNKMTGMFENNNQLMEANLIDSVDDISIIGVRQCADANRSTLNRVMWGVFISLGFALALYQIDERLEHYFSYPTSTDLDIVSTQNMTFPRITICNDNLIKKSAAERLNLVDYFQSFMFPYNLMPTNPAPVVIPKFENQTELRQILSPGMENVFLCFWNNGKCPDGFIQTTFTNVGQCLVLNSNQNAYLNRAGARVGLTLFLVANQSDYFIQETASAGFTILIHEPNEPPRMMELGYKVDLGHWYNIAISVTNTTRMKPPYGKCIDKPNYHPVKCERKCLAEQIVKNCSCRPIFFEALGNESICDYKEEKKCADGVVSAYYSSKSNLEDFCYCPQMCSEITYQSFVTGSKFSKNFVEVFSKGFNNNQSYEDIINNYILMVMFFKSMEYVKISATATYSFMALLSDVGGAMGLLLGSTILTLIEMLELALDFVAYAWAKKELKMKQCKEKKATASDQPVISEKKNQTNLKANVLKMETKIFPYVSP